MTISEFITKYTDSLAGIFRAGQSRGIGSDDMREFTSDLTTLTDIPLDFSGDYWPLTGTAEITGTITIDGNDNDMTIGDPNSLDEFQVNVNNMLHLHAYDGVTHTHLSLHPDDFSILSENSAIILEPESLEITVADGVDSSSFNILPDSIDFATGNFGVTGFADFLLDMSSGIQIIYYDDALDSSSILFGVGGEMTISGAIGTMLFDDLTIGGTNVSFDIPVGLKTYTVATLPPAGSYPRCLVWVSDESAAPTVAFSDGTDWRRIYDGNIVS